MYNLSADGDGWMSALLYLVANFLNVSPMLHKFLIILCYGYWYSFCLRLNSKLLLLISGFQQQIKPDIASPATLSFIGKLTRNEPFCLWWICSMYHFILLCRCLAAKGEESNECERFAKYYRSLCPGDWVSILQFFECCWLQYMILWMLSIAIYDSLNVC